MSFERHFDLDGCRLAVRGEGGDLAHVIDRLLGPYASAAHFDEARADIEMTLARRRATPRPPEAASRFSFPPLAAWDTADGWLLVDDVGEVRVRTGTRCSIDGWLGEPGDVELPLVSRFGGLTLWVALMECLRARGRFGVHGAGLVSPAGETVVLSGSKGAGKSTATLALAEAGYAVLSDDTLFVEKTPSGLTLLGYRKRFHIRPDLLQRRPDLAPLSRPTAPYEPQDKLWLDLGGRVATRTRAAAPTVILFPHIVDAERSHVEPVPARQALLRLLADSCFVFVRPELAPAHLACLRELADGAVCANLYAGRDLLADPSLYVRLVDEAKGGPWASSASASS